MGELDKIDFGADTDAIRRWLAKRATYADDLGDPVRGGRHRVDPPGTVDPARLTVPSARDAAQHVLDALVEPTPPVARRWPAPHQTAPPSPAPETTTATDPETAADSSPPVHPTPPPRPGTTPGGSPYASTAEQEEELAMSRSTNAVFTPRTGARRVVTVLFLAIAALTVAAGTYAYEAQSTLGYVLVAILVFLVLVVWAVRASTTVTELAVIRGQLELIRHGKFEVVDLASPYTRVLVEGKPGRRGWRVLVERHDQPVLVIDSSLVDPYHFTAVLQRIRPDQRPATTPS